MSEEPGLGMPGGQPPPPPPPAPPAPPAPPPAWGSSAPPTAWGAPPSASASSGPEWVGPNPDGVSWAPPPSSGNGCLKACLVVGLLGVGLLVVLGVIAAVLGGRFVQQLQEDPDAFFGAPCQIVDSFAVSEAVGQQVDAFEVDGFMGGTIELLLDRRLLDGAPDCYLVGGDGLLARVAIEEAGGDEAFDAARAAADGSFLLTDIRDIGDEAFCTTLTEQGSGGILVRFDDRVTYVSIASQGFTPDGTASCNLARVVARTLAP